MPVVIGLLFLSQQSYKEPSSPGPDLLGGFLASAFGILVLVAIVMLDIGRPRFRANKRCFRRR